MADTGAAAERAHDGEVAALAPATPEAVFDAHFASLCRSAYLVVGDAHLAQEVVMEAFARLLPRWSAVAEAERPVAYVRRAVMNLCVSRLRRIGLERRVARSTRSTEVTRWDADLALESRAVLDALRQLPEKQRAAVVLRYFEDLSEADIADALGCSIGTVKSQLAKARARLAGLLSPDLEVD